jgi:alkylhydroperoxidase family enzyme
VASAFEAFMSKHPPVGDVVRSADFTLWEGSALDPAVKERVRIALAERVGCAYCARVRTTVKGESILGEGDSLPSEREREAAMAEEFAIAVLSGEATDDQVVAVQAVFSEAEFSDLVFSIGWFIGMQHVGRLMHWDNACPVAPIRALVESGELV